MTPVQTPRVVASPYAQRLIAEMRLEQGPLVLVLGNSLGPVCVTRVLRRQMFTPEAFHAVIGQVAHCPVYADVREVAMCQHTTLVLDGMRTTGRDEPVFLTRPESRAERQQRVYAEQARGE